MQSLKRVFRGNVLRQYKMKIILFGATGLAGNALLNGLLQAGYSVTAFVRTPSKIKVNEFRGVTSIQLLIDEIKAS